MEEGFGVFADEESFGGPIVDLVEEAGVFEGEFDFVGFGQDGGGIGIGSAKVDGGFEFEFVEFAAALFLEVKLVAAGFPALDVLVEEAGMAEFDEFFGDFAGGDAVVEHLVDLVADEFGEVSDFAAMGGAAREFKVFRLGTPVNEVGSNAISDFGRGRSGTAN